MNTLAINFLADELRRMEAVDQLPPSWLEAWHQENWHLLSAGFLFTPELDVLLQQADPNRLVALADYVHHALVLRRNLTRLAELQQLLTARFQSLAERPEYATMARERLAYYRFLRQALARELKKCSIEQFETQIEEIDWPPIAHPLRSRYAFWVGFVYLQETQPEWRVKCRPWFEKAIQESRYVEQSIYQAFLLYYYLTTAPPPEIEPLRRSLEQLRQNLQNYIDRPTIQLLWAEIELLWLRFQTQVQQGSDFQLEAIQTLTERASYYLDTYRNTDPLLCIVLSQYLAEGLLSQAAIEEPEVSELLFERTLGLIESTIHRAETIGEREIMAQLYLHKGNIYLGRKQLREAQRMFREALTAARELDLPTLWPQAYRAAAEVAFHLNQPARAVEQLSEGLAFAQQRLGEGGFALALQLLRYTNDVFLEEIKRPGISWVSDHLETIFRRLEELHEYIPPHAGTIGREKFAFYQIEFIRFEPLSRRHIRVYLRYQYQQIKLLQLSALFSQDLRAWQLAENLLQHLNHPTNPLMPLIQARWHDFRDVPNAVRNQVLNRCISITKGDLPRASEHLGFSYRNLRSYISLGEVNRLGFFLDELETTSRPLEMGTRLLLYDLYESGTLFEVIFDLPAFIVRHSSTGFTTGDMENELRIKYNTAKKYLKLMTELKIVQPDRTPHRKGRYIVLRDRILSRYMQYKRQLEEQQHHQAPPTTQAPIALEQD